MNWMMHAPWWWSAFVACSLVSGWWLWARRDLAKGKLGLSTAWVQFNKQKARFDEYARFETESIERMKRRAHKASASAQEAYAAAIALVGGRVPVHVVPRGRRFLDVAVADSLAAFPVPDADWPVYGNFDCLAHYDTKDVSLRLACEISLAEHELTSNLPSTVLAKRAAETIVWSLAAGLADEIKTEIDQVRTS